MSNIYLSLGTNLGDKEDNLERALFLLSEKVTIIKRSSYYETEPVGFQDQPWFLNIVVEGETNLSPQELLIFIKDIERNMKRVKTFVNGPRIIDVDILLYDNIRMETDSLTIPHPRMFSRAFVIVPLSEIAPDLILSGQKLQDILKMLHGEQIRKIEKPMSRVNRILHDDEFLSYSKKNEEAESERIYCRHNLFHSLDVCRIACILNLEKNLHLEKEVIYAAGLLHDIGRWKEYEDGTDHASASKELAAEILKRCGFSNEESIEILCAIEGHRKNRTSPFPLGELLYRADKLSRNCTGCTARSTCKHFQHGEEPYLLY